MSPSPKDRLRGVARKAREAVAVPPTDGVSDIDRVVASGLFDPWYYGLQMQVEMAPRDAVEHFLRDGASAGVLPHPLLDVEATGLGPEELVAALVDGSARTFPVLPLLDDVALVAQSPAAADHPGGPAGFYLAHAHAGAPVPPLGERSWRKFAHLRGQQAAGVSAVVASGVFDHQYYADQAGRSFATDRAAIWHFLEHGESEGLSPSPLYERSWYRSRAGVRMPMTFLHFLRTGQVAGAAGPQFDGATYVDRVPEAAAHPGGPLGHFLAHATPDTSTVPDPASGIRPAAWGVFVESMGRLATEVGRQRAASRPPVAHGRWFVEAADPPPAGTGSVAVIGDTAEWGTGVAEHLATVLAQEHGDWTLRCAVDARAPVPDHLVELATDPRIVLVPTSETSWSGRAADVLATVVEPWTVVWQPQESWSPGLLGALVSAAAPDVVVHAAAVDRADGRLWGALPPRESLLWDEPRSLAAMMLPSGRLRDAVERSRVDDRWGWNILLDLDLTPVHLPFVGVRGRGLGERPMLPGRRPVHEHVRRAEAVVDWPSLQDSARVPGRVSVLMVVEDDRHRARRAIDHVLDRSDGDVEIVVVDNGSDRRFSAILAACFAGETRVRIVRLPARSHRGVAVHRAVAASTGGVLVLLDADTEVQQGWLAPLVELVGRPDVIAAQPLLLTAGDAVRSAGFVSAGPHVVPVPLFASHPVDDMAGAGVLAPDAVSGACLVVPTATLASVNGLDASFGDLADVDLCLRLAASRPGGFATATESRVSHRGVEDPAPAAEADQLRLLARWGGRLPAARTEVWERVGLTVAGLAPGSGQALSLRRTTASPVLVRPATVVGRGPGTGLPSLRWAIKIAAWPGARGDGWGDTHFADDLVRQLRRWGQDAFVDRRGAHERPGVDHLDDVTVTLRGLWPAVAQPGATNVLWVISHPDAVTADEVGQGFDVVYAAGRTWADEMTAESGQTVRVLLQATDASRFTPEGEAMPGLGTLFVGRTRKVVRPVVRDAIEVGADLSIFGNGWEEFIDPVHVVADHLDNARVPAAYRGARIVLNDHWADMARLGFYSNRLFDAVASGARVVSDPVDGLEDVLGPSVRTYRTLDELRALLAPDAAGWPDDGTLAANAARVAAEHSFEARVRVLMADVLDARGVTHDLHDRGA